MLITLIHNRLLYFLDGNSEDTLSLALWGRAQVLITLRKYSLALSDIQYAIKCNLPHIFKADAYWKMAVCYKALNEPNKANVSFGIAEKLLVNSNKLAEINRDKEAVIDCEKDEIIKGISCFPLNYSSDYK